MPVKTALVYGSYTAETIINTSAEHSAQLIVTGTNKNASRLFPYGLSTAINLAANSVVPVMIASKQTNLSFLNRSASEGPRILIADDLRKDSSEIIAKAILLAIELRCSKLKYVHIYSVNSEVEEDSGLRYQQQALALLTDNVEKQRPD